MGFLDLLRSPRLSKKRREYFHSDFWNSQEQEAEAEVPVPERLIPKAKSRELVSRLKLSQKIGLLLWLNRHNAISIGGRERLLYLQQKASFEAIEAGLRFCSRLDQEIKLQSDFKHELRELNRRPQSRHYRVTQRRRIGIGYRDKGTLPDTSSSARCQVTEESFVYFDDLSGALQDVVLNYYPTALTADGEWVDLSEVLFSQERSAQEEVVRLLRPL